MKRRHVFPVLAVVASLLVGTTTTVGAQVDDPDPVRFAEAFGDFSSWDTKNSVPEDAILFVGSSSIRFWNTAERFPHRRVINRGFGGAHISDVNHFVKEAVLQYGLDVIVFYAGDNDIAAGKTGDQILEDYQEFVHAVLSENPATDVIFVAIKPSLARWSLWPRMQVANDLIRSYSAERANLHYADVAPPMLGADGMPRPELFVGDGLHMTSAGYDVWTRVLNQALARIH